MPHPLVDPHRLNQAYVQARQDLLAQRDPAGHWVGQLSSSALSTATAVSALALVRKHCGRSVTRAPVRIAPAHPQCDIDFDELNRLIARGVAWLAGQQNPDGGWGDTQRSYSNIATAMLVVAAFHLADVAQDHSEILVRAESYVESQGGGGGVRARYGVDKTFAVPILTNYALAGRCDWSHVAPLPFELACLPQRFYAALQLPVVSYAIPALVAVGQAVFFHRRSRNPYQWIRRKAVEPSLKVLLRMQPASGGYLEAIPLTSFVVMSLAATGRATHEVTRRGVQFLRETVRSDGSWPIDTNLATWNTSLAINALGVHEDWAPHRCLHWLLNCQHRTRHPFTGAEPGGWGWSDLSGAVPDSDDTPGALLALARYRDWPELVPYDATRIVEAATLGVQWLLKLQNKDGGWPTFCRGWGKLPFDRSGTDLTAHALRALQAWSKSLSPKLYVEVVRRGFAFLDRRQHPDGSWTPLWFGNQDHPREENPVYGTAKVLAAYRAFGRGNTPAARRARAWVASAQQADGGWGTLGGRSRRQGDLPAGQVVSSVEETSLAVESLVGGDLESELQPVVAKGLRWLMEAVESGRHLQSAPIGLYFAKLWYDERLYPVTFATSALRAAVQSPLVSARDHGPAASGGRGPHTSVSTTGGVAKPMPDP